MQVQYKCCRQTFDETNFAPHLIDVHEIRGETQFFVRRVSTTVGKGKWKYIFENKVQTPHGVITFTQTNSGLAQELIGEEE